MATARNLKKAAIPAVAISALVIGGVWLLPLGSPPTISDSAFQTNPLASANNTAAPASKVASQVPSVTDRNPRAGAHQTPASLGEHPFANSLAGTDIDGHLKADANGHLIVDLATRDFFDYFLNTIGEVSAERTLSEIETLARSSLPKAAAEQALALLDQYLDYKRQALALGNIALDPSRQNDPGYQLAMLQQALGDLKQLRSASFNPTTHAAFFGLEEAYGDYTLATIRIQQRDDLSANAKSTLQAWHRQQLPEVIRQTETRLMDEADTQVQRQEALAEASSPEEAGQRLRELGLEPSQADEVVTYLTEREQFQEDYEHYRNELNRLQSAGLAADDIETRKTELLTTHFNDEKTRTWARLKAIGSDSP
ncbi:lipase secretion chaperone [Marinobacter caseinilyticus]|uniref:lipase secretion chaperone n=1 Tax=Marinobacter caseinilyticus TaxID=2692195 RepID=UPI001408F356|nr:lipase secretion chaperone [Marinobacter caseinilyticus]